MPKCSHLWYWLAAILLCGQLVPSVARAELTPRTCRGLDGLTFAGATVTDARWKVSGGTHVCLVTGHRPPFLDIEVALPRLWAGRLLVQGGSGFDGFVKSALVRNRFNWLVGFHPSISDFGTVRASSNGGNRTHVQGQSAPDVWLNGTPEGAESLRDYAYAALGTTISFSKDLIRAAYGVPASYSYFIGCSNGGRNAYTVAERWPDQFQGISAGCETMALGGQVAQWIALENTIGTDAGLSDAQYTAAYAAAVRACDAQDGLTDGIIANPAACAFDPASLDCAVSDTPTCLTPPQVATLRMLYSDIRDADGAVIYSGYPPADFGAWIDLTGMLGRGFAWFGSRETDWFTAPDRRSGFDLSTDLPRIRRGLVEKGFGHDRQAIAAYVAAGGKLISWHAAGDGLFSANDHLRNFLDMTRRAGLLVPGAAGADRVRDNARFFMVPGGNHGDDLGPADTDLLAALINWAERGQAPDQLPAARGTRTVPACAHPAVPTGLDGRYLCQ